MTSSTVLVERVGALCVVTLNRPKKLNALDAQMIQELTAAMGELKSRAGSGCLGLVMRGAGGKAFCAGGDVASVRARGLEDVGGEDEPSWVRFFRNEYRLNAMVGSFGSASSAIKQISLWDGIVMGGGAGVSAHGRFRVATERSKFAMPETAIGLFPDVGASHFLSRMPRESGTYAALTGARLDAADLMYSGLATHFVPSTKIDSLIQSLAAVCLPDQPEAADAAISSILDEHANTSWGTSSLAVNADAIERCFAMPTVEAVLDRLDASHDTFETETANTLKSMSPVSLKMTLESVRRAKKASLFDVLRTDLRLAARCCDPNYHITDFYEGVRALLVDKDRNPSWIAPLNRISDSDVQAFFAPLRPPFSELNLDDILSKPLAV